MFSANQQKKEYVVFGWFKGKTESETVDKGEAVVIVEKTIYPRYKITPHNFGFVVEKHDTHLCSDDIFIETWAKVRQDDGTVYFHFLGHTGYWMLKADTVIFKTKNSAKAFIDAQVKKKNKKKRIQKEKAKFAAENPAEWYP